MIIMLHYLYVDMILLSFTIFVYNTIKLFAQYKYGLCYTVYYIMTVLGYLLCMYVTYYHKCMYKFVGIILLCMNGFCFLYLCIRKFV